MKDLNELNDPSGDKKIQHAISLLSYHAQKFPALVFMPEFAQVKEREKTLLYTLVADKGYMQARDLYISSIIELHEAIEDMSPEERERMSELPAKAFFK